MAEMVAGEGVSERGPLRLKQTLAVVAVWGFVAIVTSFRETAGSAWPLFCIPTVLAGLLLHVPAALVVGALSALVVSASPGSAGATEWVGLGAAAITGVLAGEAAQRWAARERTLADVVAIDFTTGVRTQAHFAARIREEMRRCVRYGCSCGVLRISIDGFYELADKFGGRRAEKMLCRLAELLCSAVRETDVVGRIGQHDLGVLLPFASMAECEAVAARVRDMVEHARFEGDSVEPSVALSVSVSWAEFPGETTSPQDLLDLLDQRLSEAQAAARTQGAAS